MIKLITIFIHLIVLKQSNSIESDINHSLSNVYLRAWSSIQFKAQDFIGLITSRIETEFNALITDNNISSKCVNDVKLVLSSANKLEVWAVKSKIMELKNCQTKSTDDYNRINDIFN